MLEFSVTLTRLDLKKFIFSRLKTRSVELLISPVIYLVLAIFLAVVSFWVRPSFIVFFSVLALFFMGCLPIYKIIMVCRKVFAQGVSLVGLERKFFVDGRCLHILCESNSNFCGRYFFYDLKSFKHDSSHFFLIFSKNIYIIIPIRCLDSGQKQALFYVLNKAKS